MMIQGTLSLPALFLFALFPFASLLNDLENKLCNELFKRVEAGSLLNVTAAIISVKGAYAKECRVKALGIAVEKDNDKMINLLASDLKPQPAFGPNDMTNFLDTAATSGKSKAFKALVERKETTEPQKSAAGIKAASNGHVALVAYLIGASCNEKDGSISALSRLRGSILKGKEWVGVADKVKFLDSAITTSKIPVVNCIVSASSKDTRAEWEKAKNDAFVAAARTGNLALIKVLGPYISNVHIRQAALGTANGAKHTEVVSYLNTAPVPKT